MIELFDPAHWQQANLYWLGIGAHPAEIARVLASAMRLI